MVFLSVAGYNGITAGGVIHLFWLTIEAAAYWGIIKPEFSPGLATKFRQSAKSHNKLGPRRSDIFPSSAKAMAIIIDECQRLSMEVSARYNQVFIGKMVGLSVTELISVNQNGRSMNGIFGSAVYLGIQWNE